MAAAQVELHAEEAQKAAALVHMQTVREQMRLWWRYLTLSTNPNPSPNPSPNLNPCPSPAPGPNSNS